MALNTKQTEMLREASYVLGEAELAAMLPAPFRINVCSHSTGCQAHIDAHDEGRPRIRVWDGSIWYSSIYEFHDRDKRGWNPDFDFALPVINKFFEDVAAALAKTKAEQDAARAAEQARVAAEQNDALAHYRAVLERNQSAA